MSELQFIKFDRDKQYLIFNKEYHTSLTIGNHRAWYDLHYTGKSIELNDMEFIEMKSFTEMSCSNPMWGPAIDYGAAIGADFILRGDKSTSRSSAFSYNHTSAIFFKRIGKVEKIEVKSGKVQNRFELLNL